MKKFIPILSILILGFAGTVFALPYFSSTETIVPFVDSSYDIGTSTAAYRNAYIDQICLAGDCQTAWPSGSGSTFPFTPTSWGNSTSTILGFPGFISSASSTISYLGTGGVASNNGRLYNAATTTFSGGLLYTAGNVTNTLTAGDGLTRNTDDFDCDTASGSVFGCLASADWTTFNNKQATISATYPIILTGATLSFPATSTLYGTGTNGQVLMWSGSAPIWAATSTSAGGITSLNSQTGASQTFATSSTASTNFTITSSGDVHTLNIPPASATANGLVTTGAQTFTGAKTLSNTLTVNSDITLSGTQRSLSFAGPGWSGNGTVVMQANVNSEGTDAGDFFITNAPTGKGFTWAIANISRIVISSTGNVGIGTTTPFAKLSVHANNGETNLRLFEIASSTANATTTLFSVSNTGTTTIANGVSISAGCFYYNGACLTQGGSGTVTSIATTFPVTGGTITTTGTIGWGGLSTSSPISAASGLLYATGVNTLASISTSTAVNMSITGNAATVTTNANLSGAVTSSGSNVTAFGAAAANTVLGNFTGASAVPTFTATSSLFTWNGTGNVVRTTNAALVTPDLGTPSALVGTNISGTGASFTAGKATVLETARTINGVSFNGSANIVVASTTLLADVNTWTNTQGMSITGNAATVTTNANLSGVVTSSGNTTSYGSQSAGVLGNAATGNTAPMATSTLYGSIGTGNYGKYLGWNGTALSFFATSTIFSGTTGQFPYFSGTNTITATSSLFITTGGQVSTSAIQPATSTAMVLDWQASPNQVEYQIGFSATTITLINATTASMWGSTKRVWVCNPNGTAGALTWAGVRWMGGTVPTQTTTANKCDIYSFDVGRATSTSAYIVAGTAGAL